MLEDNFERLWPNSDYKSDWKQSPGISAESFKVQLGAILLSLSGRCLERLRDWLSPVSLWYKLWVLSDSRTKDSSWLFVSEAPLRCFTGLPVYIETVSVWYIQTPLTAWQNQLRTPREHRQLCRWGNKTLRNNHQNPRKKISELQDGKDHVWEHFSVGSGRVHADVKTAMQRNELFLFHLSRLFFR